MNSQLDNNILHLQQMLEDAQDLPEFLDTSDATAVAENILSGKTAYANGVKITGNIPTKTSSDLTASGATVTVPAGHYASNATKSVATATQATPSVSIDTTTGLITASATQTAGYVSAGTKSGTKQLTVQAATTITPSTSSQTAVAADRYTTGTITVAAIPSKYKDTSSATATAGDILSGKVAFNSSGSVTGTIATKTASNLTASGATVTVPAGYYASNATKSVATATQATPSITVSSTGLITASATQTAGYVSAGTKSNTKQLTTKAATTITPSTSAQTAVAKNVYTTGAITVAAIPSTYKQIQYTSGSFTTRRGSATVTCGFQPDAIEILYGQDGGEDCGMAAVFTQSNNTKYICSLWEEDEYCNGYCSITRTSTGFTITGFTWYTDSWESWTDNNLTYNYYAVKYT